MKPRREASSRISLTIRTKQSNNALVKSKQVEELVVEVPLLAEDVDASRELGTETALIKTPTPDLTPVSEQLAQALQRSQVGSVTTPKNFLNNLITDVRDEEVEVVKNFTTAHTRALSALKAHKLPEKFFSKVNHMRQETKLEREQEKVYQIPLTS